MAGNTWMVPGPGMHVFLGGPAGVSPGQKYLPDDLAREIVTKHDLRKGVTISKQAIQDHLESVGVSVGLTTDVAMILRNVYGVQPMFYEDNERLIGELGNILSESFPMPFREDPPQILSEDECFEMAIEDEFFETQTEEEEMMVAYLGTLSLEDVEAIAHIDECLSEDQKEMLEAAYEYGGDVLGEACIDLLVRPHMFSFTEEAILESLEAICESRYLAEDAALALGMKAKTGAKKPKPGTIGHTEYLKRKFPSAHAVMAQGQGDSKKKSRRAAASAELSKRNAAGKDMRTDQFQKSISAKGDLNSQGPKRRGPYFTDPQGSQSAKHDFSKADDGAKDRKQAQRGLIARSKMSRDGQASKLPSYTPKKPGLLKRGAELVNTFRSKVKKWGEKGLENQKQKQQDRLQTAKTKAMGREGKREPGMFSKLAGAAKRVVGRVGDHVAASARARAPRLTHMAIGKEKSGEAEARKVRQSALAKKALGVGSSPKISGRAASKGKASAPRTTTQAQRTQSKEAGGAGKVKIELPRSYAQGMSNNSSSTNQKSKARARGKVKAAMAGGA